MKHAQLLSQTTSRQQGTQEQRPLTESDMTELATSALLRLSRSTGLPRYRHEARVGYHAFQNLQTNEAALSQAA